MATTNPVLLYVLLVAVPVLVLWVALYIVVIAHYAPPYE